MTDVSRCGDCGATWSRRSERQHCTVCHETFGAIGSASAHWTKRGHVHPSRVRRLVQDADGTWRLKGPNLHDPSSRRASRTGAVPNGGTGGSARSWVQSPEKRGTRGG